MRQWLFATKEIEQKALHDKQEINLEGARGAATRGCPKAIRRPKKQWATTCHLFGICAINSCLLSMVQKAGKVCLCCFVQHLQ